MKKITEKELQIFLRKHKLWLEDNQKGERADLQGANLYRADLQGADLQGADLQGANLYKANLYRANLYRADLQGADLQGAKLYGADLQGAYLYRADLQGANLQGANLQGANLYRANLYKANLYKANLQGADLQGTNLQGANLQGADLQGADNLNYPIACPEEGSFIGFKKAEGYIVKLLIPKDAKRCSASSRKCRCDKAEVLSITNLDGTDAEISEVKSSYDSNFIYRVGEMVSVDNFNEDRWQECSAGIHFFITRQEAVDYN